MEKNPNGKQQSAFSRWQRTGRLPPVPNAEGTERKFNPWHDPSDGRFTFAGSGRHFGAGGAEPTNRGRGSMPGLIDRRGPRQHRAATIPKMNQPNVNEPSADPTRGGQTARYSQMPVDRAKIRTRSKPAPLQQSDHGNQAAAFIRGVGEGVYDVAEGAVAGAYSLLTTNPASTIRNAGRGIAEVIDMAIIAEDTPARVQISRAANAVASASGRDFGRATGSVVGNVALAVAPGAAFARRGRPQPMIPRRSAG